MNEKEGWTKPIKHVTIAFFYKKHNKGTKNDNNGNRCDSFGEDVEVKNIENEEELVKNIRDGK